MSIAAALPLLTLLAQGADLSSPRPSIGDAAPALAVDDVDGQPIAPPTLTGHITVIDFFATWCQPCKQAHKDLAVLAQTFGVAVTVLLVDVAEEPPAVRRFLAASPAPKGARVVLDRNGANAQRWGQDRFPTTFVVNGAGVVRHINRGWGPGYQARMARWIGAMLDAQRSGGAATQH
ncbi:MAG: cytochrome c biosis protein CcmG, thiol:disulfide interchange protein DsbE [Myxococcales bacterium]|jgi:thiol-disulfide isomerase/thioredoxin|nr:cytochrome c biosis protein CcmG, thiol:disulfide interchange protein DsbE [Myxococcales bacterium]